MTEEWLSVMDAAEHVGVKKASVKSAIRRGRLISKMVPSSRPGPAMVRGVRRSDVEQWARPTTAPPIPEGLDLMTVTEAAEHVGGSVDMVTSAIKRGDLSHWMAPPTNPRTTAKLIRVVDKTQLEVWANRPEAPTFDRPSDIRYDYDFFTAVMGMSDEEARDRIATGYEGVDRHMVGQCIRRIAA